VRVKEELADSNRVFAVDSNPVERRISVRAPREKKNVRSVYRSFRQDDEKKWKENREVINQYTLDYPLSTRLFATFTLKMRRGDTFLIS
jgi:hypothetical protein